jgi:oxygen-independent coproporphyrinogen-3 oxidase
MIPLSTVNTTDAIAATDTLDALLAGSPFLGYAYSYPHKTAYRRLTPPIPLADVWANEPVISDTALYLHIPFCEMRCGFCNLFTTPNPNEAAETRYVESLERQADTLYEALGSGRSISRVALGGGTPTFLSSANLERVLTAAARFVDLTAVPFSIETSPRTVDAEKLSLLRHFGVDRISMGVQSFVESEVRAVGRAQQNTLVFAALERIRQAGFPILNLDLMYGLPEQTRETWGRSLSEALRWEPEELYLYPLYVRPLTGMDGKAPLDAAAWDAQRLAFYRQGRNQLLSSGYEQVSLRFFRKKKAGATHPSSDAVGGNLVGLGCGARSYTSALHYSSEWAVGRAGVRGIVSDYTTRTRDELAVADYGVWLTVEEQKRRHLIYSLLQQAEGVLRAPYRSRFGSELMTDFPHLKNLEERGLAALDDDSVHLTERGWEFADVLGPWLTSAAMQAQMKDYILK